VGLSRIPSSALLQAAGLSALLVSWLIGDGGWLLLALCILALLAAGNKARAAAAPWLLLAPLPLLHYASTTDFRIRLACLVVLAIVLGLARLPGRERFPLRMGGWRSGRVWLLSFLVFASAAVVFHARGVQLSGDEPHYLMIAQSLVEDGDFDLRNNIREKTYFAYLQVEVRFHGTVHDGRYRSFHLPGVSFLLLPFVYLFRLLNGLVPASLYFRLVAALFSSFFALGLFRLFRSQWPEDDASPPFLLFLVTFPLLFHAVHLFPELPAASLLLFAYLLTRPGRPRFLAAGWLLAAIPWLHFKYAVPTAVFALFTLAAIGRSGRGRRLREVAFLVLPTLASVALLALYSRLLYGSLDPRVISPEKGFLSIPLLPKIETLLSFFLDQRDGLLVYAPVLLALFLACGRETRRSIRDFPMLASIFASYVLFHAGTTVRGGYSPAARPTLFVFWIMAVLAVAVLRRAGKEGKSAWRFLAGMGAFASVWLLYYPLFVYQPVTREVSQRASSLLWFLGSRAVDLSSLFPSFLKKPNAGYLPDWIWLAALAIGLALYYSRVLRPRGAWAWRRALPLLGLAAILALCIVPHVQLRTRYGVAGLSLFNESRNFSFQKEAGRFQALAGQDYDLYIDLAGSVAGRIDLRLLNPNRADVRVRNGRRTLLAGNRRVEARISIPLSGLRSFSLGRRRLLHIGLESARIAGISPAFFWVEFR